MMTLHEFFPAVGGNYETVLRRLPSEALIRRFLGKFKEDTSYAELTAALAASDLEEAFRAAHTLKGTAANLGLDGLSNAASVLTDQLRGVTAMPEEKYAEAVKQAYENTVQHIGMLDA